MNMKKVIWTQGTKEYKLGAGLGSWAKSLEPYRIQEGDTRVIKGVLMYASRIYTHPIFSFEVHNTCHWVPVDTILGHDWTKLTEWVNKV